MSRQHQYRKRQSRDRKVIVFSETNSGPRPSHIAKALTLHGLEQARREAEAAEQHARGDRNEPLASSNGRPDLGGAAS